MKRQSAWKQSTPKGSQHAKTRWRRHWVVHVRSVVTPSKESRTITMHHHRTGNCTVRWSNTSKHCWQIGLQAQTKNTYIIHTSYILARKRWIRLRQTSMDCKNTNLEKKPLGTPAGLCAEHSVAILHFIEMALHNAMQMSEWLLVLYVEEIVAKSWGYRFQIWSRRCSVVNI